MPITPFPFQPCLNLNNQVGRDKRAKMLMDATGAKHMTPNALAPLSNEEQQISAELAWNHHDYIMSLVSMGHEDLKEFVAKPECMLGFSDQVPVWVKRDQPRLYLQAMRPGHMGRPSKRLGGTFKMS